MKYFGRLGLALVVGLAAVGLNIFWAAQQKTAKTVVGVSTKLEPGDPIWEKSIRPISVPGEATELGQTYVLWPNRSLLYGMKAPRTYAVGDLVLQRDIQVSATTPEWEILGPFRLLAIGETLLAETDGGDAFGTGGTGDTVTVAVPRDFDEKTRRLIKCIDPKQASQQGVGKQHLMRIVALEAVPTDGPSGPISPLGLREGEVALIVPLRGVEISVPVLKAAGSVQFIIPALAKPPGFNL